MESLLMEMVRQSTRRPEPGESPGQGRRPRLMERRRFLRGPRVEPELKLRPDPELRRQDEGLLASFRKLIGRR